LSETPFDCIICDRFHAVREPGQVLAHARTWLAPRGQLIAAISNLRHHSVLEGLLEGRWPFSSDRQLRFFTRREIEKLFYRAGFAIAELRPVPGEGYQEWVSQRRPGQVRVGALHIAGLERADAEEFY